MFLVEEILRRSRRGGGEVRSLLDGRSVGRTLKKARLVLENDVQGVDDAGNV
jgi:hypothetical protein